MKFIQRIDAETDDIVLAQAMKEYSYMLQLSALFVNLRPKWRLFSVIQFIVYYLLAIFFLITLLITATEWENDINNTTQAIHIAGFTIVVLIILTEFSVKRADFVDYLRIAANNYYIYSDGFQSKYATKWKKDIRKMKIMVLIFLPLYYLFCAFTAIYLAPIIDDLQGFTIKESYINSIYTRLPVPLVLPFEVNNNALHYLAFTMEVIMAVLLASVVAGADLALIFYGQDIAIQLKLLKESVQEIENRAFYQYKEINGNNKVKNLKQLYKDEKFMKIINKCIKQNVEHHKIICHAFDIMYTLSKWPTAAAFMVGSAVIALSLFSIVSTGRIASQLFSMELLLIEIGNMFIICWIGQQLTDLSAGLSYELYNTNWMQWNKSCKMSVLIFRERLKRPLNMSAGGLTPINMETFGT
uniref:Odorant receptor n=1 Tax=Rhodnius prolixus TaxID=13249 RepID=T1H8I9_RHOPR